MALAPRRAAPSAPEPKPDDIGADIPVEVAAMEIHLRRAPTWKRVLAWLVDGVVLGLFAAVLVRLARGGFHVPEATVPGLDWLLEAGTRNFRLLASLALVLALAAFVYLTLGHALMGATLGKQLLRIRVIAGDGRRPSLTRSAVRSAIALATLLILGLGPLLSLFTRSGRALHDLLSGTYVVEPPRAP